MSALTKAEMVEHLTTQTPLSRRECKEFIEAFFEELKSAIIEGETVKLSGFGNFEVRKKCERPGRNPKTGELVPITARRVVTFRAGQKFRQRVEEVQRNAE